MGETLPSTTIPGQSGPGSNGNENVLHTHQSSRTTTSPSDAVYCRTLSRHPILEVVAFPPAGDTIIVFIHEEGDLMWHKVGNHPVWDRCTVPSTFSLVEIEFTHHLATNRIWHKVIFFVQL